MYLAEVNTRSTHDRLVAGGITTVLLVGLLSALHVTSLPDVKQKTDTYEEINWTKFRPKPKKIVDTPKPKPIPVEPSPVKFEPPPPVQPQPKPVQKKIDLSALKAQFEPVAKPAKNLSPRQLNDSSPSNSSQPKISLKKSKMLAGLNTLTGESSSRLKMASRGSKARGGSQPAALKMKEGQSLGIGRTPSYGGGSPSLGAPQGKEVNIGAPQIDMVDLSQFGGDFADISAIYRALIEWMKQHPANFPGVVGRFMEQTSGDLSSVVKFQMGGREFEMFLMCKESQYEVRVCLLEGNQSTYLIDRGFKENSSFLRAGSVNRASSGNVLSFGTSRQAASSQRAREFYQIFLSWWDSVNK